MRLSDAKIFFVRASYAKSSPATEKGNRKKLWRRWPHSFSSSPNLNGYRFEATLFLEHAHTKALMASTKTLLPLLIDDRFGGRLFCVCAAAADGPLFQRHSLLHRQMFVGSIFHRQRLGRRCRRGGFRHDKWEFRRPAHNQRTTISHRCLAGQALATSCQREAMSLFLSDLCVC